jgi:N-acetylneuraminate synthase
MTMQNGLSRRSAPPLKIGRVMIGADRPCVIIAEAACEHHGRLSAAKRLAQAAKSAGAEIVKFQLHLPHEEMLPGSITFWAGSMDDVLKQVNLSIDAHRKLKRYCEQIGIQYLCTAYCAAGVDVLDALGVPAFKIGSGEMTNLPMIRHVARMSARKRKPVLVSTGMSTMEEIVQTVAVLKAEGAQFMLLNCTSEYPPQYPHVNLGLLPILRRRFGVLVGHSDHSPENYTAFAAVALGAAAIEKHFTLSRKRRGPDWLVSIEPGELKALVDGVRKIGAALGSEKRLYPDERIVRRWAHHSVVSLRDIARGSAITPEAIGVKRPGWGIPAKHLEALYGRVAKRDIPKNALVRWNDVK